MPLTPQDVHSKVFGPTRFRRGYDEAEVDAFLDEVEVELTRLHREIDSLRAQLGGAAPPADGDASSTARPVTAAGDDDEVMVDATSTGGTPGAAAVGASSAAGAAQAAAHSLGEQPGTANIEQQVARTLVLAQRAADEAVRDAEQEAEQLRVHAQSEAEQLRLRAESEAERLRTEAEEQAERDRREGEQARREAEDDVEQLRAFEREYRNRLRAYLELQLRDLEGVGAQVESTQRAALSGGGEDDGTPAAAAGAGAGVGARTDTGAGAGATASGADALLTTHLPEHDPASVPPVAPLDEGPAVPSSVPVDDYAPQSGVTRHAAGEEHSREPRDLHDSY